MYGRVCSLIGCAWSFLTSKVVVLLIFSVLAFNGLCLSVFAQGGNEIAIEDSGIDWASTSSNILGKFVIPILAGIAIYLSIRLIIVTAQLILLRYIRFSRYRDDLYESEYYSEADEMRFWRGGYWRSDF